MPDGHQHAGGHDQDAHDRHHEHGHKGIGARLRGFVAPHSHDAKDSLDQALEASSDGGGLTPSLAMYCSTTQFVKHEVHLPTDPQCSHLTDP